MKKIFIVLLLALFTLPAIIPLLHPGFFPTHDGAWMVVRLTAFHQSLRDGQFPVRWSNRLNHGFGYPVLNFLYPLPFYLGEVFYLISGSFTQAIKLVFIFSFLASGLTMFYWLKSKLSFWPALAGAVVYIYTPYRFVDTYVRGSLGESLGFVFIPLLFLSIDLLPKKPKVGIILGALSVAATVLAHNVFVIFVLLSLIYGLITLAKTHWLKLTITLLVGAALSAYFWLPALVELKYVYVSRLPVTNPADHLLSFKQLLLPSWGYGPSSPGSPQSMSFQIGVVNLIIIIVSLLLARRYRSSFLHLLLATSLLAFIFMHRLTSPLWSFLPGIKVIQFPWRLLSLTTFATAALAAYLTHALKSRLFSLGLIVAAILLNLSYAHPSQYTFLPDDYYATNDDTTTVQGEYLPLWVIKPPTQRIRERAVFVSGTGDITDLKETNSQIHFKVDAVQKEPTAVIKLAQTYYPGWKVNVNSQPVTIDTQYNGVIAFTVPKNKSTVLVLWQEPPFRKIANYVSLLTLLVIFSHLFCINCIKRQ